VQLLTAAATAYTPPGDSTRSVAGPKPEVVSDAELLDRFWRGGEADARAFVQRFQTRVYGLAVRILQDRGVAEDVAQEAFVRAWRKGGTYDPARGSVDRWLLRITRNLAIDEFRRRTPDVLDPHRLDIPGSRSAEDDPAASAVISSEAAEVLHAVSRLPDEQRRAVLAAAVWGRTALEISRAEGVPLGTAKTRIRRGLLRLRATLGVDLDPSATVAASY
jgi:RNA polymerase sigma-70 factor (ECF subfamily)